jgi:glycosyltransferase involved in cell wall biosynthesis
MKASVGSRVLMLLENNPYPQDARVRQEARTLTAAGYQVCVICPKDTSQPWQEIVDNVHVFRFPPPLAASGFIGYLWEYGFAMAMMFFISLIVFLRKGFDVVHTHNPPDTLVLIAAFYKVLGKRFVYDHHDLAPEMYHALFDSGANGFVHKTLIWFEQLSCRLADHVIATNHSYKAIEMRRGHVPEERVSVVRNGPDLTQLRLVELDPRLRQQGKTMVCYVGSMGFHDGVDYLLRAVQHLVFELNRSDFFCVLVGAGEAWPHMKALSEQLCVIDYVLFTGRVAHSEVPHYLSAADICVAPEPSNGYNDRSTMIKMMEYMALGKPIVAFDLPEHRFTAQKAALYARPNDELDFARRLAQLMDDPKQRQQMGQAGRERVERELAWSHQAPCLLEVYEKVLGKPRSQLRQKLSQQ